MYAVWYTIWLWDVSKVTCDLEKGYKDRSDEEIKNLAPLLIKITTNDT